MDVLVLNFSQESRQKRHGRQSFAPEVCTMTAYTLDRAAGARLLAPLALALLLLVAKALSHAEAKLKSLGQETRYKQEDKQFLLERWRDLKVATEGAIRELESARKDFAELLRKLQTSEDFIDELLQIQEHQRAL